MFHQYDLIHDDDSIYSKMEYLFNNRASEVSSSQASLNKAVINTYAGKSDLALNELTDLEKSDPKNTETWIQIGSIHYSEKRMELALHAFNRAILIDPYNKQIHYSLGLVYAQLERYEEAIINLSKAGARGIKDAHLQMAIIFNRLKQYSSTLQILEGNTPENCTHKDVFLELGIAYHKLGDYQKAMDNFNNVLEINPNSEHAWINIGRVYQSLGDFDKTFCSIGMCLNINEQNATAWCDFGDLLFGDKQYYAAIKAFQKAIEYDKNELKAIPWNGLGVTYSNLQRHGEALHNFQKAVAIDSNYEDGWRNKALCHLNRLEFKEALTCFEKAQKINPFLKTDQEWIDILKQVLSAE